MAQGPKSPFVINLSLEERHKLEQWQRSTIVASGLARREKIILLLSEGTFLSDIAREESVSSVAWCANVGQEVLVPADYRPL
jgi:hypothetical protein